MSGPALGADLPLPDFIVIGTQKGGTHWVRDVLSAHSDVFMPDEELHFFTRPGWIEDQGVEGYRRMFAGWQGEPVVGEATPGYLMPRHDPAAIAEAIDSMLPGVRLIAVLRNPVDRAHSALTHLHRLGVLGPDDRDLVEVTARHHRPEDDEHSLVAAGRYASCLRPYLDRFGDRLLVLLSDDLEADAGAAYDQLLEHVGLPPGLRPAALWDRRFSFSAERYGVEPLTPADRQALFVHFEDDVVELEGLLDRDLSCWRPDGPDGPDGPAASVDGARSAPVDRREARLLDLGCGAGDSLAVAQTRFGLEGVGIDRNPERVAQARARGLTAYEDDLLDLDPDDFPNAEIVYLDNVLEHLASLDEIDVVVSLAARIASSRVVIRHPSFEDVDYLAALGVKLYWTDWPGAHTAPALVSDLVAALTRHGLHRISIDPIGRVRSSSSPLVLPLDAPSGQQRIDPAVHAVYREEAHGPKPDVAFAHPVYTVFEITAFAAGAESAIAGVATSPPAGEVGDVPGHTPRSWRLQLEAAAGCDPLVVERASSALVVVEAGMMRPIPSPLVARALRNRFGLTELTAAARRALRPGPPVVLIKASGESAFVVVGGRRCNVPGMGVMVHTEDEWYLDLASDAPLDVLRAAAELQAERAQRDP